MNNDNDLNLRLYDQMSGWLRYWLLHVHFGKIHVIKIFSIHLRVHSLCEVIAASYTWKYTTLLL